jgi:hypothetical protein
MVIKVYNMKRTETYEEIKLLIGLCKAGKLFEVQKWIADGKPVNGPPSVSGYSWHEDPDPEYDQNALELAAEYEHFDVFNLKKIRIDPEHPDLKGILIGACRAKKSDFLQKLLKKGFKPREYENSGTPLIQALLTSMSWYFDFNRWDIWSTDRTSKRNIDNEASLEKIKMIHMLAKHGAKWLPKDRSEIGDARRSLLKLKPDYTVEFIWIMSKYNAGKREDIEELIRTPSIRSLIYQHMARVNEFLTKF